MRVFIRKVMEHTYDDFYLRSKLHITLIENSIKRKIGKKNIWLLGIPKSKNLGDQAQVVCSENWFNENYPEHKVFMYNSVELMCNKNRLIKFIANIIKSEDIVFFQSGYNLTDLYPFQERMHREVIKHIKNNKIIYLPQTVKFEEPYEENEFLKAGEEIYKSHSQVYLICRDNLSYDIAQKAMPYVGSHPFPDVVTNFIGRYKVKDYKRKGAMLCIRRDVESSLDAEKRATLIENIEKICPVEITDTTVEYPAYTVINHNRKKYVFNMIDKMSKKEIVITDRYHGLIFSIVSGTPVILIKTIDHKITEGVKWFPEFIAKHIRVVEDINKIDEVINEIKINKTIDFEPYFYNEYYKKLKGILDEYFSNSQG